MIKQHITTMFLLATISTGISAQNTSTKELIDLETIEMVSGYSQELKNAPASAVVINREMIDQMGAYRLSDVLERVTGLHISPSSDAVATVTTIRGITSRFLILYNGVPLAQQLINAIGNIDSILLYDVERIEVMRGPNSAVYGADSVIGTVNLVTKSIEDDTSEVGGAIGSDSLANAWIRNAGSIGAGRYGLYFGHHETDGSEETIKIDRQTLLDLQLGTDASLAPGALNQQKEINEFRLTFDLPGGFSWRNFIYDQRHLGTGVGNSQALDPIGENNYTLYTSELIYKNRLHDWDINSNLTYAEVDASGDNARLLPAGTLGGIFPDGVIQNLGVEETRWRYELSGARTFGKHKLRIGLGGSENKWKNRFDRRNYTVRPESPFPLPVGTLVDFTNTDPIFDNFDSEIVFGYLQDEWHIANDWHLTAGLRVDDYSNFGTAVNPRLGLVWNAGLDTTIKFLYGEAFRPPSPIENSSNGLFLGLGNSDLDPAKLRMFETAIDHRFSDNVDTQLSLYTYEYEDLIGLIPNSESPSGLAFVNLDGEQEGYGFDWSVKWKVNDNLTLKAGWAYQDLDAIPIDTRTRYAAKHLPSIEADLKLPNDWHLNAFAFGVYGRDRIGDDQRSDIDDYEIVNLALTKKDIYKGFDVSLTIQNIFDTDAREPISPAIVEDLPVYPQQIFLQLGLEF